MNKRFLGGLLIGLILFSSGVSAMECTVQFRAKRVQEISRWYGKVEKPQFRSGTVSGVGNTLPACERNALSRVRKGGWNITYSKVMKSR